MDAEEAREAGWAGPAKMSPEAESGMSEGRDAA